MYRVAIVENESESVRYPYASLVPKLKQAPRFKNYEFTRFDAQGIASLLTGSALLSFDALVITTNATSDENILRQLRELGRPKIEEFLATGKGLFISSQKKLSTKTSITIQSPRDGYTGFLPTELDVCALERPERSSSEGQVSVAPLPLLSVQHAALLKYPYRVTDTDLRSICARNEFKPHTYRSYLVPGVDGAYGTLIHDSSYGENRRLVVVSKRAGTSDRVVLSSMALDWAWHEKLLCNIIVYIAEGLPRVAFVSQGQSRRGDFEYLVSSAALSKIPHEVYAACADVPDEMIGVHGIYVVAPETGAEDAAGLWARVRGSQVAGASPVRYRRMYRLREEEGELGLIQHSSHSSVDAETDRALAWLDRRFAHAMWGSSFWNTYEVVAAMLTVGLDMGSYLPGILRDIQGHYKAGSYDGVVGATCGLLEACVSLAEKHSTTLEEHDFGRDRIMAIADWLVEACPSEAPPIRQTCALALARALPLFEIGRARWHNEEQAKTLIQSEGRDLTSATASVESATSDELDAVRVLRLGVLLGTSASHLIRIFRKLQSLQRSDGSWGSIVRTAHVVEALLDAYDPLSAALSDDIQLNSAIYSGVLHLRSTFDARLGNWGGDIQSTAKSISTLVKHNKRFAYSTQDFHDVINRGVAEYERGSELAEVRADLASLRVRAAASDKGLEQAKATLLDTKERLDALATEFKKQRATTRRLRAISTVSSMLLMGLIVSMLVNQRDTLWKLVSEIGSLLPLVIGAIIAIPITNALSKDDSKPAKE